MSGREPVMRTGVRWLKFNAVGAGGIVVQLAALGILKSLFKVDYLLATALAVEAAVVHNYLWHERYTWRDRATGNSWLRFLKFNGTTGLFSILGNVLVMRVLVGEAHLNYFVANILTIATCSILNFLVSDRFVFEGP
jgi:putative flippase GtrA